MASLFFPATRSGSRLLRLIAWGSVLALMTGASLPAFAVQGPEAGPHLELASMPPWHEPGDELSIGLNVINSGDESLEGFSLAVSIFQRVQSRSALHASYADPGDFEISLFTKSFASRVPAGETKTVSLRNSIQDLPALDEATESGVYPIKVELFDPNGVLLDDDPVVVPLVYYPSPPQSALNLSLTMPLDDIPRMGPDGSFPADGSGRSPLERAVARTGWLFELVRALKQWTKPSRQEHTGRKARRSSDDLVAGGKRRPPGGLRLGLAPAPRLMEEISAMGEGYRRAVGDREVELGGDSPGAKAARQLLLDLGSILRRPAVQPMLGPYVSADLSALQHTGLGFGDSTAIQQQLTVGERVLDSLFRADFEPDWIVAPGGRLDGLTLDTLKLGNRGDMTLFAPGSLRNVPDPAEPGCPESSPSWLCPVLTRTEEGATRGYVVDEGLTDSLAALAKPGGDRLDLQKVLAETATIWAELPGRSGRIVHATTPAGWKPKPSVIRLLVEHLATAPWLASVTPQEGLTGLQPPTSRTIVEQLRIPAAEQEALLVLDPAGAHDTIESFSTLRPPGNVLERLRRNVLVSQSSLWWSGRNRAPQGQSYAEAAQDEANHAMSQVRIGAASRITLTSQKGKIKLEVFNDGPYDVEVGITLISPQLNLDKHFVETIPAGKQVPLQVQASAETSGTYQVVARIEAPDGYVIPESETDIFVRSTQFNRIALGLTIGALAFLVFFYLYLAVRRRRTRLGQGASAA